MLAKLTALHIWGEETGFEIQAVCTGIKQLEAILQNKRFDLLILENQLVAEDNYRVLKNVKSSKFCNHIALCSLEADFESARKGIVLGVDDYFTLPFEERLILSLFNRIKSDNEDAQNSSSEFTDKLLELFFRNEDSLYDFVEHLYKVNVMSDVIDKAVKVIFEKNDWLDLYVNEKDYIGANVYDTTEHKSRFIALFESYKLLLPNHSEMLSVIIEYILYNPESDLRQKAISEELRINKSYLSTVFIAQTGIRFVDYITYIKLMRAAWLLRNTDMKVNEIAKRMDYKDVAYFSKQFKKNFSITPSEYRLPDDYHFEI
ncbi:MAG: helix-turn-helix domain-containing protein [Ruminococcus sp.]|nr:helix-turn-helix domain-containing protein [Ruminococcus sp.]